MLLLAAVTLAVLFVVMTLRCAQLEDKLARREDCACKDPGYEPGDLIEDGEPW